MKLKTSIPTICYIILGIVAIFFIILHTFLICSIDLAEYLEMFCGKVVEIMASGLFPAILLAYLTDLANTNRQIKKYEKFKENIKRPLLLMCEALPMTLYDCVLDYYSGGSESFWEERKSFVEWCNDLYNKDNVNKEEAKGIKYFLQEITQINREAKTVIGILNCYQDFCDEKERVQEIDKLTKLSRACDGFCLIVKEDGTQVDKYKHNAEELVKSITNLFSSYYITKGYVKKYNCKDYDVEESEESKK